MNAHRGHVSGLALGHDEKSVFSAGWDGDAIVSGAKEDPFHS